MTLPLLASAFLILAGLWLGAMALVPTVPASTAAVFVALAIALEAVGAALVPAVMREDG